MPHRSNETRPILDGLAKLAEKHHVAVLILRHASKNGSGRAIYRGLGSIDFTGAVRCELTRLNCGVAQRERARGRQRTLSSQSMIHRCISMFNDGLNVTVFAKKNPTLGRGSGKIGDIKPHVIVICQMPYDLTLPRTP